MAAPVSVPPSSPPSAPPSVPVPPTQGMANDDAGQTSVPGQIQVTGSPTQDTAETQMPSDPNTPPTQTIGTTASTPATTQLGAKPAPLPPATGPSITAQPQTTTPQLVTPPTPPSSMPPTPAAPPSSPTPPVQDDAAAHFSSRESSVAAKNTEEPEEVEHTSPLPPAPPSPAVGIKQRTPVDAPQPIENTSPEVDDKIDLDALSSKRFPDDLGTTWRRTKCLNCGYVHEGETQMTRCPKCGNTDPDKFGESD